MCNLLPVWYKFEHYIRKKQFFIFRLLSDAIQRYKAVMGFLFSDMAQNFFLSNKAFSDCDKKRPSPAVFGG